MRKDKTRIKGYWQHFSESFANSEKAKERQGILNSNDIDKVANVKFTKDEKTGNYVVTYSVAKWYAEECNKAKVTI